MKKILDNNSEFDFINTFPPLGHPEHHFNKYPNHPWLKSKREILNFIEEEFYAGNSRKAFFNYEVNDDLTVSYKLKDNVLMSDLKGIPIQIRSVASMSIYDSKLDNLIGIPYSSGYLFLSNNNIKSLEGLNGNIDECLDVSKNKIYNFKGMVENKSKFFRLKITLREGLSWDEFVGEQSLIFDIPRNFVMNDDFKIFLYNLPSEVKSIKYETGGKSEVLKQLDGFQYENIRAYQNASAIEKNVRSGLNENSEVIYKRKI